MWAQSEMKAGEVTGGRFRVGDRIGAGGMATIYQADDLENGGIVALKVHQYLEGFADPGQLERFDREAEMLAGLDHPGIVRYTAHGTGDGMRWLAMEWLEGEDLASRLRRSDRPRGSVRR